MGSEKKMNDATSFQQSDNPILCANGCGFFGTSATMNLCSKCYRDYKMREEQAATAKAAVEKSMSLVSPLPPPPKVVVVEEKAMKEPVASEEKAVEDPVAAAPTAVVVAEPSSSEAAETEKAAAVAEDEKPRTTKANSRCGCCSKRVGVMGFKCRCGSTFCGSHRYPEEHGCSFDYKGAGGDAIAKANPLIKADKIQRL